MSQRPRRIGLIRQQDDHESWKLMDRINGSPAACEDRDAFTVRRDSLPCTARTFMSHPIVSPYSSLTPSDNVKGRYLAMEGQFIGV